MAVDFVTTATEQWIRETLQSNHPHLADVRSLSLPGTYKKKISHLGDALKNFICLRVLDLSYNALVSIKGIEHLKGLERLILYFNCISSLDHLQELYELPALRELDLRLNPVVRRHPHYRLYLAHNMPKLRTLDERTVSERERTTAAMQFPSHPPQRGTRLNQPDKSGDQMLALDDHVTKTMSLRTGADDVVAGFRATHGGGERWSLSQKQKNAKYLSGSSPSKNGGTSHQRTNLSIVTDRPKVSFGPSKEKCRSVSAEQKKNGLPIRIRHIAKGYYTPNPNQSHHSNSLLVNIRPPSPPLGLSLSDLSNPTLCPSRLIYCTVNKTEGGPGIPQQEGKRKKGGYRKPLEMLLNLVDKHWTGEKSLHHHNFLSQGVHILSMMEKDVSTQESEVKTLRGKVDTLNFRASKQTEEHQTEVRNLSARLHDTRCEVSSLSEQLRIVLLENVSLQKQLLSLERRYLRCTRRSSPITQIEEAKQEVEELRKEMEGLKERVEEVAKVQGPSSRQQGSHRSLTSS